MAEAVAVSPTGLTKDIQEFLEELIKKLREILEHIVRYLRDRLSDLLTPLVEGIRTAINQVKDKLEVLLRSIADAVGLVVSKLESVFTRLQNIITNFADRLIDKLTDIMTKLTSVLSSVVNSLIANLREIVSGFRGVVESVIIRVRDAIASAADKVGDILLAIGGYIGDKIQTFLDAMREGLSKVVSFISEKIREGVEFIENAIAVVTGIIKARINLIIEQIKAAVEWVKKQYNVVADYVKKVLLPEIGLYLDLTAAGIERRGSGVIELVTGIIESNPAAIASGISDILARTDKHDLTFAAMAIGVGMMVLPQVAPAFAAPALEYIQQQAYARMPISPLTIEQTIGAFFKGLLSIDEVRNEALKRGIAPSKVDALIEAARPLPSPGAIQEAFLRGFISESEHDRLLRQHGYTDSDIALFKSLYFIIPTPSDLIRMAVREVFSPAVAEKFGQFEDFPEVFAQWARKIGISEEWAKNYWAAHWDLPSATQGFEMLHRRIINEDELKMLLRALDVMPFWREKLIQLSYNPYTRVDLRRMYSLGILSEEDVYNAYLDLGYDPEKARNLTEFTIRHYAPEEETTLDEYRRAALSLYQKAYKLDIITLDDLRNYILNLGYHPDDAELILSITVAEKEITERREELPPLRGRIRDMTLDAFKRGIFTRAETEATLSAIGYSDDEITWLVILAEYEREHEIKELFLERLRIMYVNRSMDKDEVYGFLGQVLPTEAEIRQLLMRWDVEREIRIRKPSESVLRRWWKLGLLSDEEFLEEMRGLGYAEKYVALIATELGILRG